MQNGQTANRFTFKDSWKEGIVVVRTRPARERVFWMLTSGLDLIRWLLSSSCGPMRGTATVKVSETANFSYVTDLSVTECVYWRLKPWAMQDLSVEVAGMSGMTGGTTSLQNQNNLLFVNAAKNKRAFIVVCCPDCVTKSSKDWTNMRTPDMSSDTETRHHCVKTWRLRSRTRQVLEFFLPACSEEPLDLWYLMLLLRESPWVRHFQKWLFSFFFFKYVDVFCFLPSCTTPDTLNNMSKRKWVRSDMINDVKHDVNSKNPRWWVVYCTFWLFCTRQKNFLCLQCICC